MVFIPHVKQGQPLSARTENQKIDAINSVQDKINTLFTPKIPHNFGLIANVRNSTGGTLHAGETCIITGIRFTNLTKSELMASYLTSGLVLTASAPVASSPSIVTAFALEPAKSGKLFKAFVQGIVGAMVSFTDASHGYAIEKTDGLHSAKFGNYKIIGSSNETGSSPFERFCIVYPVNLGHVVGTTQSTIQGPSSETDVVVHSGLTIEDVKCPMLRSSESITSGSKVVVSFNVTEHEFEIIEAQCPEGSGS